MANYKSKEETKRENIKNFQKLMAMPSVQERFIGILNKNASGFMTALMTVFNDNGKLQECAPNTVIAAAGQAAILKLPIIPTLGYAYIVPFWDGANKRFVAQFQLGHKGLIQLAMRSGQYRTLHSGKVFEGQIRGIDFLTGKIKTGEQTSNEVIGYVAYMELVNGFEKTLYMSKDEIIAHAKEYSQSYKSDLEKGWKNSPWSKNFDAMAEKTVLKRLLTKYAPTSIDMESSTLATALKADQSEVTQNLNCWKRREKFQTCKGKYLLNFFPPTPTTQQENSPDKICCRFCFQSRKRKSYCRCQGRSNKRF